MITPRIGEFRELIDILNVGSPYSVDGSGTVISTFKSSIAAVVNPLGGKRDVETQQIQKFSQSYDIWIRYISGVTSFQQIVWDDLRMIMRAPPEKIGNFLLIHADAVGLNSTSASTISGGDHSRLTHLDYESAGHTGFAPTIHPHSESDITGLGASLSAINDLISAKQDALGFTPENVANKGVTYAEVVGGKIPYARLPWDNAIRNFQAGDIPGVQFFWRSDLGLTKDPVTGKLSRWVDQIKGHVWVQDTEAEQAVWADDQVNGYPSIKFNAAAGTWMHCETLGNILAGYDRPLSIFLVFKTSNPTSQAILSAEDGGYNMFVMKISGGIVSTEMYYGSTFLFAKMNTSLGKVIVTSAHTDTEGRKDLTLRGNGRIWVDRTRWTLPTSIGCNFASLGANTYGGYAGKQWFFDGELLEIIGTTMPMDDPNVSVVEQYATFRYGMFGLNSWPYTFPNPKQTTKEIYGSSYNLASDDFFVEVPMTAGDTTIYLPPNNYYLYAPNTIYAIKRTGVASAGDLIIKPDPGDLGSYSIEGQSEFHIPTQNQTVIFIGGGSCWRVIGNTIPADPNYAPREKLAAARDYYVRTDGSDMNTGRANDAAHACLTIQKAIDLAAALDFNNNHVTIHVADGTYASATIPPMFGVGADGYLDIEGNRTTPANCFISDTNGPADFKVLGPTSYTTYIYGFKVKHTTGGGVYASPFVSMVDVQYFEFNECAGAHMFADRGSFINNGGCTISGNAAYFIYTQQGGKIILSGTVTLTVTPAFTIFAYADYSGLIYALGVIFSGSATGKRYLCQRNAIIETGGGGANYFPGNTSGSAATQGQYL